MTSRGGDVDLGDYEEEMKQVFHIVPPSQQKEVKRVIMNKPILSSTNLQMFLYYNFFYSLAFAWFFVLAYRWKYLNHGGLRVQYFTPIFFSIWVISEIGRIYVGYQGNLKEDTPNMAAFLFLTIFPQMLITIYFLAMQVPLYGFDRIFSGIMLAFLIVEFLLAWRCLGVFIADKTARFSVEYGGVEGTETQEDQTEVIALNRFITDDDDGGIQDGFTGVDQLGDSRGTLRRARTTTGGASESSRLIAAPTRDGPGLGGTSTLSFGGPTVQPLSRSVPRGHGAPPPDPLTPVASSAHPDILSTSGGTYRFGGLAATNATLTLRENETPEERAARRARDRAIIAGELVPERRRGYEDTVGAEEIARERDRIAAAQAEALEKMAANRPVLASLTTSTPHQVRIPYRAELASPSTTTTTTTNIKRD